MICRVLNKGGFFKKRFFKKISRPSRPSQPFSAFFSGKKRGGMRPKRPRPGSLLAPHPEIGRNAPAPAHTRPKLPRASANVTCPRARKSIAKSEGFAATPSWQRSTGRLSSFTLMRVLHSNSILQMLLAARNQLYSELFNAGSTSAIQYRCSSGGGKTSGLGSP